jgi:hypothetical protein
VSPKRPRFIPLLLATAVFGAGCGPFGYIKRTATDASKAVSEAEASNAETHAPYEYWGAKAYLEQSKVMMAYSEYERSFDYGARAQQLALEAKIKADRVEAGESVQHADGVAAPEELSDEKAENPVITEGKKKRAEEAEASKSVKVGGGK